MRAPASISTWRLELPSQVRSFDYMTISDAILHIRYTARYGGAELAKKAADFVSDLIKGDSSGLATLFSLPHDFPAEWTAFVNGKGDLAVPIGPNLFPYLAQGKHVLIDGLIAFALGSGGKLAQYSFEVPNDLSDGIGSVPRTLTLHPDGKVLAHSANAQVFLIVQYHLGGPLRAAGSGGPTQ